MEVKKYKVRYEPQIIRNNDYVRKNGFSCILFDNTGEVPAWLEKSIELKPYSEDIFELNERPDIVIDQDFEITFDSQTEGVKSILVIKAYYEEV